MESNLDRHPPIIKHVFDACRSQLAGKREKGRILDELCANTGWHRNHARRALAAARKPKYGPEVIAALTICWSVLGMPAGKRLAPMLGELVAALRHFGELSIDEHNESAFARILT